MGLGHHDIPGLAAGQGRWGAARGSLVGSQNGTPDSLFLSPSLYTHTHIFREYYPYALLGLCAYRRRLVDVRYAAKG